MRALQRFSSSTDAILALCVMVGGVLTGVAAEVAAGGFLVSSRFGDNVLLYDEASGAFERVFADGGGIDNAIGMDIGPDGHLYVASGNEAKVFRYNGNTGEFIDLFVWDDPNVPGDETSNLQSPRGMMFGPDGNLYVSSGGSARVNVYNGATGAFVRTAAIGGGLSGPIGLCFGEDGHLYVAGGLTGQVYRYDGTMGTFIDVFASIPNQTNATGLLFGPNGNLFVGSGIGSAVYEFDGTSGNFIRVFASGNGLNVAIGLTFDSQGILYVASFSSDSVVRFDSDGNFIDTFVAPGAGGLDGTHFMLFRENFVSIRRTSIGAVKQRFR